MSLTPCTHQEGVSKTALSIIAKPPVIGEAKTRLARDIGHTKAITLYRQILEASATAISQLNWIAKFACTYGPREHVEFYESRGFEIIKDQPGCGVKGAIHGVFSRLLLTFDHVMIVASDDIFMTSEAHASSIVLEAARGLADNSVVVGPTVDGGVYLIGLSKGQLDLIEDLPYSDSNLREFLCRAAVNKKCNVKMLTTHVDADTASHIQLAMNLLNNQGIKVPLSLETFLVGER